MRHPTIIIILFLLLLGASGTTQAADPPATRPNVVILLTDDQGTLDMGCYGSTDLKTPHMDRLAAGGVRFTQAYAHLYDGNEEVFRREEYYPDLMIERAVQFIEANKAVPFFMMVAFNLPHYPEEPLTKFKDAYADLPMPRQSYARVISTVDYHIGRVLDKLDATGLSDNTIVILMSDNGHSTENNSGISVDDHASEKPEIVRELTTLHDAWAKSLPAE